MKKTEAARNLEYGKGLARAFGGALLFSLPLLMTMEMWSLGFSIVPWRLLLFVLVSLPVLLGLSYYAGFEPAFRLRDEVLDALAAFAVGFILAAALLAVFGVIGPGDSLREVLTAVVLAAVPAAIGALLAGKQFAGPGEGQPGEKTPVGLAGVLFLMSAGALFLAFNVAPTEEVVLIAQRMAAPHALVLLALSIGLLHVFVYNLGFPGQEIRKKEHSLIRTLLVFTIPGYGACLIVSTYVLWTFGRLDGGALHEQVTAVVVLAFPAALGAATARLVV